MSATQKNGSKPQVSEATPPKFDDEGFFGIRLESIGGLGAHLAGQLMAETAILRQGLNGAHFSSYGSEKKGSPVKSYVRLCASGQKVRTSSPVERPQVIAVFHEALASDPGVLAGRQPDSVVIVNSAADAQDLRHRFGLPDGTLGVLDALRIAVEEGSRVNTAMLGAIARVSPMLTREALEETIRATFQKKYPHLVEANLRTFRRGYDELSLHTIAATGEPAAASAKPAAAFGYLDAPMGGTILNPGNTIFKDLTSSRQGFIPAFDRAACVHCGLCDLVCPDFCFNWGTDETPDGNTLVRLRGIDYQYCKGCLKCIDACPTTALTVLREKDGYVAAHTVPLYPWLASSKAQSETTARQNGAKGDA
jgi:pyruvate ferredoxin oxidoreductase gamma subunit